MEKKKHTFPKILAVVALLSLLAGIAVGTAYLLNKPEEGPRDTVSGTTQPAVPEATDPVGSQGLEYTLSSDGTFYCVTGIGTCTDTSIVIPAAYEGLPVTAIGERAFYHTPITQVQFPDTITSIEKYAFMKTDLESVRLPEGLTVLRGGVFQECEKLKSVTFSSTITQISEIEPQPDGFYTTGSFYGCTALQRIEIPGTVKDIGVFAFDGCSALAEVVMAEGVERIFYQAFAPCEALTAISFPASLTCIEDYAFSTIHTRQVHFAGTKARFLEIHPNYYVYIDVPVHCSDGILE